MSKGTEPPSYLGILGRGTAGAKTLGSAQAYLFKGQQGDQCVCSSDSQPGATLPAQGTFDNIWKHV